MKTNNTNTEFVTISSVEYSCLVTSQTILAMVLEASNANSYAAGDILKYAASAFPWLLTQAAQEAPGVPNPPKEGEDDA